MRVAWEVNPEDYERVLDINGDVWAGKYGQMDPAPINFPILSGQFVAGRIPRYTQAYTPDPALATSADVVPVPPRGALP